MNLTVTPQFRPVLDPEFLPAVLWNRAYTEIVRADGAARPLALALIRPAGGASVFHTRILSAGHPAAPLTLRYAERLLKFLLWQRGGCRVLLAGADELVPALNRLYSPDGERAFDHAFMGGKVYGRPFTLAAAAFTDLPADDTGTLAIGRHLEGCRIGFDLGGSDRKAAALIDGRVVYSEEIPWDPYFQKDPAYHLAGVQDTLARAAAHLPRVDAIGGSAAGVYVNNEVRVASLFRGVPDAQFERHIRRMFFTLQARWGGVPFEVANDGEVTALAGSMAMNGNAVLGVSLGTSQAAGYVTPAGSITPWLNELAFAPIDYRTGAPRDEWSGDAGCGVQYFSQQGVARLAALAGFEFPADRPLPERLVAVQAALAQGDERARAIFESIGVCFGYAIAHYGDFYPIENLLILGRVTSGAGGEIILERAATVLRGEFPALAEKIRLRTPDEKDKRHGQAIAAASLPRITQPSSTASP
ncbi:ROK family protein [Horticoccus luteus]|uniref:ROK family protein n=1 Tax=Horticoccus luteus TaxID=2862869 RepID=A0A8F9XL58_9BACT|nr:ROK family protein [Horticoccus luteus]QYM78881.1 ROK family protein [Horticoccus luteus]